MFSIKTLALWTSILSSLASISALPTEPKAFLLVTTNQKEATTNSSILKAVSATSLFDPYNRPALYLRLQTPAYASLPNFTLSDGTLHTYTYSPHGTSFLQYNSTTVQSGQELSFLASNQTAGNIGLDQGYLLTVDGESEGWTVCEGKLETDVLFWKGEEGVGGAKGCEKTYLHAVGSAPY